MAIVISERRSFVSVRQETLRLCDSCREVRRLDLDAAHRRVQAMYGICIRGRRGRVSHRAVVGPEGDGKTIAFVHLRFHPRIERCDGGRGCGEALGDLDLKGGDFLTDECSPGERVTWQET